ncbi:amidohydrolase family protein [Acidisphaera sp. L21]|uniref:amidohydrolase family protein n=1 Tax=Acidisphaera sp. L21 TaxID=1641851 RepID=UPI00131B768C|nr:amidohydrolase family protein [Acidisphaera sp. L21]
MQAYELIIHGGRVMDPETGFDVIADVAITAGRIAAIGTNLGTAAHTIDATGLVVAPGFIDLHAHGQSIPADRMQAFDGVTTALELELGVFPVARWYDEQAHAGRLLNYGASTGWVFARIAAMTAQQVDPTIEGMGQATRDPRWVNEVANSSEMADILDRVRTGLGQGGLGIGFPNAYAPGTGVKEMSELCSLAADANAPTFTHVAYMSNVDPRSSVEAYTRLIGYAGSTGAHMHICHFNSTSLTDVERAAQLVQTAQRQGLKVTVEAYPYGTGSTVVGANFFSDPDFPIRFGTGYQAIEMVNTGHRFADRADVLAAQAEDPGALVLIHFLDVEVNARHRDLLDVSVLFPGGAIASDAVPWTRDGVTYNGDAWPLPDDAVSHPRSSGTFTRFLSRWVRERQAVSLMEGLRKCTLIPAQILQDSTPGIRKKGRVQVGCDADLVVFDYEALADRADFKAMNRVADGMRHVLVNGQPIITAGVLDLAARPGRPVRRPVTPA